MTEETSTLKRIRPNSGRQIATLAAILLAAVLTAASERSAVAGTYSVHQCNYELSIAASSFEWRDAGTPSPIRQANSGCDEFGLAIRTSGFGSPQTYPGSAVGGYVASAPSDTAFTRFSGAFGTLTNCCVTGMEAYAQADEFASGAGDRDEIFRGSLGEATWLAPSGSQGPVRVDWDARDAGFSAKRIGYFLGCGEVAGCPQSSVGDIRVRGRSFEFTLEDVAEPRVDALDGDLLSAGWVRGTRDLSVEAVDQGGGLVGITARLNDELVGDAPSTCSKVSGRYVELRPCPLSRNASWAVDTRSYDDGVATLSVRADDAGGFSDERLETVKIDNTPPTAPVGVAVADQGEWKIVNDFGLSWDSAPESHAPISAVHYEMCPIPDGVCEHVTVDAGASQAMQVQVPDRGIYEIRLWFEDAAGNVDSSRPSDPVVLKFDDAVPGRAQVAAPARWVGAVQSEHASVSLDLEDDVEPISGIAGYSITTDGSSPDGSVEVGGRSADYVLGPMPEGVTVVRSVAVSGAGQPSNLVGAALAKIDRSAPLTLAEGILDVDTWQTRAVRAEITSSDQTGLSGVSAAPLDRPVDEGGYMAIRLDNGPSTEVRGDRADVAVETDGRHTLRYRAFDAAGNGSVEKEVGFKIDGTAPVGAFRALDPGDPRALRVDVADATSGVADGRIEYRREGEGGFRRLATVRAGGVLNARLDDQELAPGRYEVRAVVTDVAGNEAVVDHWADGSRTILAMPLRLAANMSVAGTVKAKGCGKAAKKRRGSRGGRKRAARPKCRRKTKTKSATTLGLRHGKRAPSSGRLETVQGAPIAHAPIVTEGQARSGGPFVRLGAARTDARGNFRFAVPAGPSRTIRYRYEGTNTVQPTAAQLTTKVAAAARLKVDRRRLRNGQAVRFTGRLLGKPIPKAGKLVALQAKVGRGWRTFATPRANKKGIFRHRYRFTATTGVRRYKFRAVVEREDAYPYEAGVSRIVRVIVRGR
jgi:hypothetical protein